MKRIIISYIAIVISCVFILSLVVGEPGVFGRGLMMFLVVPGVFLLVTVIFAVREAMEELNQERAEEITGTASESHELAIAERLPASVYNDSKKCSRLQPNVVNNYFVIYKSDKLGADLEELPPIEGEWVELRA